MNVVVFKDEVFGTEKMVPASCPCCAKCWIVVESQKRTIGKCIYGGPYRGYVDVPE